MENKKHRKNGFLIVSLVLIGILILLFLGNLFYAIFRNDCSYKSDVVTVLSGLTSGIAAIILAMFSLYQNKRYKFESHKQMFINELTEDKKNFTQLFNQFAREELCFEPLNCLFLEYDNNQRLGIFYKRSKTRLREELSTYARCLQELKYCPIAVEKMVYKIKDYIGVIYSDYENLDEIDLDSEMANKKIEKITNYFVEWLIEMNELRLKAFVEYEELMVQVCKCNKEKDLIVLEQFSKLAMENTLQRIALQNNSKQQ